VVVHFNNISSIFRDWFWRIKTGGIPPPTRYLTKHCPLNTALSAVSAVQKKTHLQLYRELDASNYVCGL